MLKGAQQVLKYLVKIRELEVVAILKEGGGEAQQV